MSRPALRHASSARLVVLRSLTAKITLLFCAITGVAVAVVYFYVVPQLETNLQQQRLRDVQRAANTYSGRLEQAMGSDITDDELNERVRQTADQADGRVTLFGVQRSGDEIGGLYPISDSRVVPELDLTFEVAEHAVRRDRAETGLGRDGGAKVAQAAVPLGPTAGDPAWVALYSRNLGGVGEAVGLIRRQVLVAGGLALLVSALGGYLIARALARRVRRLEAAAGEVAEGSLGDPLPIDSEDELGQLTRTFNEMQDQLARVDRARRDFIANASHELRTPIFSLAGFAELLEDEDLDPDTRAQFIRSMREQVGRLQKLAVDLLDLSRLDAGSLELRPRDVDLSELAQTVVGEFKPALTQNGTELDVRLQGQVEAYCDPERVTQIMRILLDNALRHTPEGTRVTVSAGRQNGAAEFTVADTGKGLASGAADRVFERFYTADAARGSGLGLAIARELAERMNGQIRLRSRPGATTFTLALPPGTVDGTE
jgi:signal transduction histidine kinase